MMINGGPKHSFIVFHNLGVLDLNGDDGDDTFFVRPCARRLAGRLPRPH